MNDYLWDRSGDPGADRESADAAKLEAQLRPLAFDPEAHPFSMPSTSALTTPPRPSPSRVWRLSMALAACLFVAASAWEFQQWRLSWPDGQAWSVNGGQAELAVGASLDVTSSDATVEIARLGVLTAARGTELRLASTSVTRHRLAMRRGQISVRVWAPPARVTISTPAGTVIDLGCIFDLRVDDAGVARLRVDTGWVSLRNGHGESFIPAGASSEMSADRAPLVPVYDDAPADFRAAIRSLEAGASDTTGENTRVVIVNARARDTITLLMLSDVPGLPQATRRSLLERAALLTPPPQPDTVARVLAGDRDRFWGWYDSLPLPPLKSWWRNWRDIVPR